ncbi:diguanylate cyclase [Lysobacter psychrotolerans]|uniref:diguanylate cyclase n=1 Tax=Montanilutibacter psychrotolerans TaxID=1327343 RepID=A0A3M8SQ94_9GAMM|nr:diguanylate cyclase [Lysobacter psychrotolerans]
MASLRRWRWSRGGRAASAAARVASARPYAWLIACLLMVVCLPVAANGLQRIDRIDPEQAAQAGADATRLAALPSTAFEPAPSATQLSGADARGRGWWRLHPVPSGDDRVLLVYHPYSARLTVLAPPDYRARRASIFQPPARIAHSQRALAFDIDAPGPIWIGVEDARYPLQVALRSPREYAVEDHAHVRVLWLALGLLIGVALVVLMFWSRLRERVYLLFAASLTSQLLYVLCSYGDAYVLPGLHWLARFGVEGIWFVATSSTILTVLFLLEFAQLRPRVPWLSRALLLVGGWLPGLLLVALVWPGPSDRSWFPPLGNLLLLVANALAILSLAVAWWRGGRHAGFVLIAWVPLVTVSTARAVQLGSGVPLAPWLEYGLPVMEAFAALVLVLGLADRMLAFRRERDVAQNDAQHDALTGVLNRAGIERELRSVIVTARRQRLPLSVLFLDLDHFKRINDNFGHAVGDACLRAVVAAIRNADTDGHPLGRIGGEEFLLLLPAHHRRHARDTAEAIRLEVETSCREVDGAAVELTLSIGVVDCGAGDDAASLIRRADEAMYEAKHAGRNRVVVVDGPTG